MIEALRLCETSTARPLQEFLIRLPTSITKADNAKARPPSLHKHQYWSPISAVLPPFMQQSAIDSEPILKCPVIVASYVPIGIYPINHDRNRNLILAY